MRAFECFYGPVLTLLVVATAADAQSRDSRDSSRNGPNVATATPLVQVITKNPREINLGKPATFVISVSNTGKTAATGVIIATTIPDNVEITKHEPAPLAIEGNVYRFRIGDLEPGRTREVTLVAVPQSIKPVRLDTTVTFATSTRASLLVREPALSVSAKAPPRSIVGQKVDWTVRITNTGDGTAERVLLTPSIIEGDILGNAVRQPIQVGTLRAGETKDFKLTVVGSKRGKVTAQFKTTNPDGLSAETQSTLQVLQAELALKAIGPRLLPVGREGDYEVVVSNSGDSAAPATLVTVKVPAGLEITSAADRAYNEEARTLRWRVTTVRPTDNVRLRFKAEAIADGDQTLSVTAECEEIPGARAQHITSVLSRPNLIVTVVSGQELAAIGEPNRFEVRIVNAGSRIADDLQIRVAIPQDVEGMDSGDYTITGGHIEFPPRNLGSGEKTAVRFQTIGRTAGDHRLQILISSLTFDSELTYEASTFCYSEVSETTPAERTAERSTYRRTRAPYVTRQPTQP